MAFPREVLLVEIERHCAGADCGARTRVGLTKAEARLYDGFACGVCERWHEDGLTERDIPDWWEELTVTGLGTLRGTSPAGDARGDEGDGVVARLSDAWQRRARREGRGAEDAAGDGRDESL
ncbi:MAG TPA: hypothetical protein VGA87_09910 [Pyrinomonadaceae bacterium]